MSATATTEADPLLQARHFCAHAARALFVLVQNAAPDSIERALDLQAGAAHTFFGLFPEALVNQARGLAVEALGLRGRDQLGNEDVLMVLVAMVEMLDAGRVGD